METERLDAKRTAVCKYLRSHLTLLSWRAEFRWMGGQIK